MYSNDNLRELVEVWQEHLRLRDWLIITKVVEEDDDEIKEKAGQVEIRHSVFEAIVELNSALPEEEIEPTIYHELAHIQVKSVFWILRQILENLEPEDNSTLTDILNACEELQTRHIEFLISRMMGKAREAT
jgi:site-specific recombinase